MHPHPLPRGTGLWSTKIRSPATPLLPTLILIPRRRPLWCAFDPGRCWGPCGYSLPERSRGICSTGSASALLVARGLCCHRRAQENANTLSFAVIGVDCGNGGPRRKGLFGRRKRLEGLQNTTRRNLMWVDRMGREEAIPAPPRAYQFPRLSPDPFCSTKISKLGPGVNVTEPCIRHRACRFPRAR